MPDTDQDQLAPRDGETSGLRKSLLVTAPLFLIAVFVFPAKYEVNDDFGMILSLAGLDGFAADQDARFISRVLSESLHLLYQVVPAVPWYGLMLYSAAFLGTVFFLSVLFQPRINGRAKLIVLPAWLAFLGHCAYSITFTSATLVLELGVFLYLASYLTGERNTPFNRPLVFLGLALAYLWRWKAMLFFGVFASPLLFFARQKDWRPLLPVIVALAVLVIVDRTWDGRATTADDQQFQAYSKLRSQFHDSPMGREGPNTAAALAAAGWTKDDHQLFLSRWILYDESVFNSESLRRFLGANTSSQQSLLLRVRQSLSAAWGANSLYLPIFVCIGLAVLVHRSPEILSASRNERMRLIGIALVLIVPISLLIYQRFVARISLPIFSYVLGIALVCFRSKTSMVEAARAAKRRVANFVVAVLFVLAFLAMLRMARADLSSLLSEKRHKQFIQASMTEMLKSQAKPPLLIRMDPRIGLGHASLHPLAERREWFDVRLLPSGWAIHSPRFQQILRELGYASGSELLRQSIDNPNVLFVLYERPQDNPDETRRLWQSYLDRHVAANRPDSPIAMETVRQFDEPTGERLLFYRLTTQSS